MSIFSGGTGPNLLEGDYANSLRSTATARILDLISEGEIEGLVNGLQSIYLDETPVQNADGTFNFKGISIDSRTGTQTQDYMPGFSDVENGIDVNVQVKNITPIVRTVSDANINAVRVTLSTPALSHANSDSGDISGSRVDFAIDLAVGGGGYNQVLSDSFIGKTTSKYQRSYRITLSGTGPWLIRVRRVSADNTDQYTQNDLYWDTYTEIIDTKLRYPNSAYIGLTFDAQQFDKIPSRAYDVKLLKVQIPTNYDPIARTYTGAWDGTFKTVWTDNPAWCFYDLLTQPRYGLGGFLTAAQVDKWSLYTIAQYCDQLVPDGFGGMEPRFRINLYLASRDDAYKVINDLASIFRGMAYWAAGSITAVQDSPADTDYLYTAANVIDGLFTYAGTSAKGRHTAALVTWNDPADFYRQKVEYVADDAAIVRYGYLPAQVTALGCTSRGQAHRVGQWLLLSEQNETETVTFRTGLEGMIARPGQIIAVADPNRAGTRFGGRIAAATASSISLDAPVTLTAGQTYTVSVIAQDGTVEDATVNSPAGTTSTLALAAPLAKVPQPQSIWVLSCNQVEPQLFRVITVSEVERNQVEITALAHNPSKYDAIEQGWLLEQRNITLLNTVPDIPTNLRLSEFLYEAKSEVKTSVVFACDASSGASSYLFSYKRDNDNWVELPAVKSPEAQLNDAKPGTYIVNCVAVNAIGVQSQTSSITGNVYGKNAAPADITGFSIAILNGLAQLSWDQHPDLDVRIGGNIVLRHSTKTSGATWNDGVSLPDAAGSQTKELVPLLAGTYMAKARDSSGNYSVNAVYIETDMASVVSMNVVATNTQDPAFQGQKTSMAANNGVLQLDSASMVDAMTDVIDNWQSIDSIGGVALSGSYTFDQPVDLGAVYTSRVTASITALSYSTADTFDFRTDNIDSWDSVDGNIINDVTLQLFVSTTNDDPNNNPTWSGWKPFIVGDYSARALRFQVQVNSQSPTHNINITGLAVTVNMPDRMEGNNDVAVPSAGLTINFSSAFKAIPAIGINVATLSTGDYYTITGKSPSGFTVQLFNSAGAAKAGSIDWIAKGYGKAA